MKVDNKERAMMNDKASKAVHEGRRPKFHRWVGRLSVGFLVLVSSLIARTVDAHWVFPNKSAWAYAVVYNGHAEINQSSDRPPTIQYLGVGSYLLVFPALWNTSNMNGGDVQVTNTQLNNHCKVTSWAIGNLTPNTNAYDIQISVKCFNSTGGPRDSSFEVSYVERETVLTYLTGPTQEGGYVRITDSTTPSYESISGDQWNSTGAPIMVSHTPGSGAYSVVFVGQNGAFNWVMPEPTRCSAVPAYNGGTVEVTASGAGNAYCTTGGWQRVSSPSAGTLVYVNCWNGRTGKPQDSPFDLVYDTMSPTAQSNSAFVWASLPTASSYTAAAGYTAAITLEGDGNACPHYVTDINDVTTAVTTITRTQQGIYSAYFPYAFFSPSSITHVTALGNTSNYCVDNGTSVSNSGILRLEVNCFLYNGKPADTQFVVTYGADSIAI